MSGTGRASFTEHRGSSDSSEPARLFRFVLDAPGTVVYLWSKLPSTFSGEPVATYVNRSSGCGPAVIVDDASLDTSFLRLKGGDVFWHDVNGPVQSAPLCLTSSR